MPAPVAGLLSLLLLPLLSGCQHVPPARYATVVTDALNAEGELAVRSGQVIVSDRASAASVFVSLVAAEYSPYVHAGIVVLEADGPYVYEAFGRMRPSLSQPPTRSMGGGIRRVRLASFLARTQVAAVYDPPVSIDRVAMVEFARRHLALRTPFDGYFDWRDANAFYCTEFVARALQAAGGPPPAMVAINRHPSLRVALAWLAIDTPSIVTAGSLIEGMQRAALLSREYSPQQLEAHFAARRALHAQFAAHHSLGSVFRWSVFGGLRLRPELRTQLEWR